MKSNYGSCRKLEMNSNNGGYTATESNLQTNMGIYRYARKAQNSPSITSPTTTISGRFEYEATGNSNNGGNTETQTPFQLNMHVS